MSKKKTFALQLTALPVKDQEWLAYDFIFTFDTETKTTSVIFDLVQSKKKEINTFFLHYLLRRKS